MRKVVRNDIISFILVLALCLGVGMVVNSSWSRARLRVYLSRTEKTYDMTGLWDKIMLKNAPSGAKIVWKSSDKSIVRIREHFSNGVWYQVKRDGGATITATYRGRKYRCRIRTEVETAEEQESTPKPSTPEETSSLTANPQMTAAPVHTSDPEVTPSVTPTVLTVPSASPTPTASPASTSAFRQQVEERLAEFITEDMSEYDRMFAIVEHVSNDYDYELGQYDFQTMFRTGSGDCMASRCLVEYMARVVGLRSYALGSVSAHGRTVVRAGDRFYLTVTGTNMPRPRTYMITELSREELERLQQEYPSILKILGAE